MKTSLLPKVLFVALLMLGAALPMRAANDTIGAPVSVGTSTYTITAEGKTAFMYDEDKLRRDATDAANKFCEAQGKTFKLVTIKSKVPVFSTGYAWAKVTFMALDPKDPMVSPAPAAAVSAAPGAPVVEAPPPPPQVITTDEMYTQLLKLDDLRKKGILTQAEFDEEKKKVLSHTQ